MGNQDSEVMNGLLGKIFSVLGTPDEKNKAPSQPRSFISYVQPGIPISEKDLMFGDLSTADQISKQAQFSYLVNKIPKASGFWSSNGDMIWSIYEKAITDIDLPDSTLSEPEQAKINKVTGYLEKQETKRNPIDDSETTTTVASDYVKSYNKYKLAYQTALMTYNSLMITATAQNAAPEDVKNFNLNGPVYSSRVTQAYEEWQAEGNKSTVEQCRGVISMISGKGAEARYNRLKANLEMNKRSDPKLSIYYPTFFYPEDAMLNKDSWTKVTYKASETEQFSHAGLTSWGGGLKASWGLFSCSANVQNEDKSERMECDSSNLNLDVELMQLPIIRPWYDGTIFNSRSWKWAGSAQELPVSDGAEIPSGQMPVLTTSVILARNLNIGIDTASQKNSDALKKLAVNASASWGPFSLKGNYRTESEDKSQSFRTDSKGIHCAGMQIIGFVCDSLPKSPDPDPSIKWN